MHDREGIEIPTSRINPTTEQLSQLQENVNPLGIVSTSNADLIIILLYIPMCSKIVDILDFNFWPRVQVQWLH